MKSLWRTAARIFCVGWILVFVDGCVTKYVYVHDGQMMGRDGAPANVIRVENWTKSADGDVWRANWVFNLHQSVADTRLDGIELKAGGNNFVYWLGDNGPAVAIDAGGNIDTKIIRQAGTLAVVGRVEGQSLRGTAEFDADAKYEEAMTTMLGVKPTFAELVELTVEDVQLDYFTKFHAAAPKYTLADIMTLRRSGVTSDYVDGYQKAGYEFSSADILRLHNSGIPSEYPAQLKAAMNLDAAHIIGLHNSGIPADFAVQMIHSGLAKNSDEIIKLHNSGISAEYAGELKQAMNVDVAQIIELHNSGISPKYVLEINALGVANNVKDIIKLHNSGVSEKYCSALKKAGYDLSIDEFIRASNNGIPADYMASVAVPEKRNLSVDEIIRLHNQGVDAATIRKLRE